MFGALGDARVPDQVHARDILLGLRFQLDLYVNFRPVQLLDERHTPLKGKTVRDIDFVVLPHTETIGLLHLALRPGLFRGKPWATISVGIRFHHARAGI